MGHSRLASVFVLGLLPLFFAPSVFSGPVSHLHKVGEGEMSYLFWTLYEAQYFIGETKQELQEADKGARALRIEYYRAIDSQALIEATADQWQHLGYGQNEITAWVALLEKMWPSVEQGNSLTLKVSAAKLSQFYFNDDSIGVIEDPSFGDAFLAIWLSEGTSEPELRARLLGLNQ